MLRKWRAAIFDLDGTLFDSTGVWKKIDEDFLRKRGFAVPYDYSDIITPMTFYETAVYTIKRFGLDEAPEEIMAEWRDMAIDEYSHNVRLKPCAREYLEKLKARGIRMAVATAATPELYIPALKNNKIYEIFDAICSTDEVGKGKSSPDIFILAAQKLGVKPADCLVFEDVLQAICSAKSAGMSVCGVYDKCSSGYGDEMERTADRYIMSFSEAPLPD